MSLLEQSKHVYDFIDVSTLTAILFVLVVVVVGMGGGGVGRH